MPRPLGIDQGIGRSEIDGEVVREPAEDALQEALRRSHGTAFARGTAQRIPLSGRFLENVCRALRRSFAQRLSAPRVVFKQQRRFGSDRACPKAVRADRTLGACSGQRPLRRPASACDVCGQLLPACILAGAGPGWPIRVQNRIPRVDSPCFGVLRQGQRWILWRRDPGGRRGIFVIVSRALALHGRRAAGERDRSSTWTAAAYFAPGRSSASRDGRGGAPTIASSWATAFDPSKVGAYLDSTTSAVRPRDADAASWPDEAEEHGAPAVTDRPRSDGFLHPAS